MNIISYIKAVAEAITGFNECVNFSQWVRSLRSHSNGTENQELKEDDVLKLQGSFQCLEDTLPAMYNFIDRVEWRSHEKGVAELLPELKAAVYDAEDLLEDFRCYKQKVKIEGSVTSAELGTKFFQDFIQSNFNTKLTVIKNRLDNQSMMLERMGLHQATLRFDRSVRPETTSFPTVAKIFGRDEEIKKLIRLLGATANNGGDPSRHKRKRSAINSLARNQVCTTLDNNGETMTSIPVLPIIGIGGVGKTTLAQNICNHPHVKSLFDKIVWICVSDDFNVKRLTKEAIEQLSTEAPTKDNLNSLQYDLANNMNKGRFLIVLDDIWTEDAELWRTFNAPFRHVLHGSMMLVTTRSQKVADMVRTTDPFLLEGLKDDIFQKFFKQCVFGSDSSNKDPELEWIGKQILPKLKGSPLAAKTLGRLLGMSLDPAHWNTILNSQLWELKQEGTDILPALRLSYMYLPFHLKRCFSFCAVYPKDYNFEKEDLAEIWMAEGFVEPEHNIPLQQTSCKYFEELVHLSFFQKLHGKYVMHDLIHDMAQLVSKDDCFIIKRKMDLQRIPQNIRHLSVLNGTDVEWSDLLNLCKQTKLRTLLCYKCLHSENEYLSSEAMEKWCAGLFCMRVMICDCASMPNSVGNMKNLRYLKIWGRYFNSFPASFCRLYNLQLFYARKCCFKEVPRGFSNLTSLLKFESKFLIDAAMENGEGIRLLKNFNPIAGDLSICNVCEISKDQAAEIELTKREYISSLTLKWYKGILHMPRSPVHNDIEVSEALRPPTNIKSLSLFCYPGEYLPSWLHCSDDPTTIFSSLTEMKVTICPRLASLTFNIEKVPLLTDVTIQVCRKLETLNGDWSNLQSLSILVCPLLKWENGIVLPWSLRRLNLWDCGYFSVRCLENLRFLDSLEMIKCKHIEYIPSNLWSCNLVSLEKLTIMSCEDLVSIGGPEAIAHIPKVDIQNCPKLKEIQQPLSRVRRKL